MPEHADFERDFRGDTIHPATMQMLDRIGLADDLHRLRHGRLRATRLVTPERTWTFVPPLPMRVLLKTPVLRDIPARMLAFAPRPYRLERPDEHPPA